MVNVLTANFAFDKKIAAQDDLDSRVTEAQSTESGKEEGPGMLSKIGDAFKDKMASFGEAAKEKSMALMGGLKGMLIKGGFIFGLLAIATLMKKYGKEIAEVLTPVVDGIKKFFSVFSENIGPLFKQAVEIIKTSFTGIIDIFKGIFTGDASTFFSGVKKIFLDLPIKLIGYIGDAFFSLLEAGLAAFGIESEMVTNIKNIFRNLPESIQNAFDAAMTFITETIPQFFTDMKDAVVQKAQDIVTGIKDFFINTFESIKTTFSDTIKGIGDFFGNIADKIKTVINSAIESLPLPQFVKDKLKFETKATKEAGAQVSETGGLEKYKDDMDPGKRQAVSGGGVTGDEALAESIGELYSQSKISKSGTSGYDFASGIMTGDQFKEFEKIKDVDAQLAYLKNLDDEEQARRQMIIDMANKQKEFMKKIESLKPEFGGEIVGPDDQMLRDDKNLRAGVTGKQINSGSADLNSRAGANSNMVISKGGNTNTQVANNTYTTILEDTNTSDSSLREALSA